MLDIARLERKLLGKALSTFFELDADGHVVDEEALSLVVDDNFAIICLFNDSLMTFDCSKATASLFVVLQAIVGQTTFLKT